MPPTTSELALPVPQPRGDLMNKVTIEQEIKALIAEKAEVA